jgi:hypothetical protein
MVLRFIERSLLGAYELGLVPPPEMAPVAAVENPRLPASTYFRRPTSATGPGAAAAHGTLRSEQAMRSGSASKRD